MTNKSVCDRRPMAEGQLAEDLHSGGAIPLAEQEGGHLSRHSPSPAVPDALKDQFQWGNPWSRCARALHNQSVPSHKNSTLERMEP